MLIGEESHQANRRMSPSNVSTYQYHDPGMLDGLHPPSDFARYFA
jgi:hypothetical protein